MRHDARGLGALAVLLLGGSVALAGSATVKMKVVGPSGAPIREAVFVFSLTDDASQDFTIDENEAGLYEKKVQLAADDATWNLTRIVAPGWLPVKVDLRSLAPGGEVIQEASGVEVSPAHPVPAIRIVASGSVQIDLRMGDQKEVMQKFLAERAAARAEREEQLAQEQVAQGPYADAVRLYNAGDVEGSLPYFEQAVAAAPDDQELRVTYAGALYKAQRYDAFEPVARAALEQDPSNTNLWMMLYSSARARGDMKTALEALLEVKKLGGGKDLLPHLTFVAQKLGQDRAAIPAWQAILELDDRNVEANVGLASIYEVAGQSSEAQRYLGRAVELDPDNAAELYYNLAMRLLAKANPSPSALKRGAELLEMTIKTAPDKVDAYRKLGMARWQAGDYPGARQALQKYLELKPDAEDRDTIAEYLARLPE